MLTRPLALVVRSAAALVLGLTLGACKPKYDPGEPVDLAPEGCCKLANETMNKFAGCRLAHRCKNDEPIWIRGAVKCTAVDQRCAGGRCCELRPVYGSPDAVLNWDDPDAKKADPTPKTPAPAEPPPPDASETPASAGGDAGAIT